MTKKRPSGPSLYLIIIFCLFTALYTFFVAAHADWIHRKGGYWWYFIKFLLIDGYAFFILQGIIRRPGNWGILLLLPLACLVATIIVGYILVWIIRLGGGTLLNNDTPDMILAVALFLTCCVYSLRWIGKGKKSRI